MAFVPGRERIAAYLVVLKRMDVDRKGTRFFRVHARGTASVAVSMAEIDQLSGNGEMIRQWHFIWRACWRLCSAVSDPKTALYSLSDDMLRRSMRIVEFTSLPVAWWCRGALVALQAEAARRQTVRHNIDTVVDPRDNKASFIKP